jgi:hypothetical protein
MPFTVLARSFCFNANLEIRRHYKESRLLVALEKYKGLATLNLNSDMSAIV